MRNNLLNFKTAKRFVEFVVSEPGQLEDMLADGGRFRIEAGLPRIASRLLDAKTKDADFQQTLLRELGVELLPKKILLSPLDEKDMEGRLVKLYRAARSAMDEGGANTLYLVMGFLSWRAKGRSTIAKAPLLLLPMRLERRSVRSGFTLTLGDDEPRFNLTLLEMLRKDYGLTALDGLAAELPTDGHGLDIKRIWHTVQLAIKDIPGWEVSPTVALGLFSFAKYLMWKDLHDHAEMMRQNSVVEHLLSPTQVFPETVPFVEAEQLDRTLQPHNVYCPLLADSSQLAAIASAADGKDFVLIGPPGTGKSQTIANMIAQCLAEGKTVLFVAEKTAALNVVHRRLKKIGLGEFCLELHSSKAHKAGVLAQLAASLEARIPPENEDWTQAANRLCQSRDKLNAYVRHLHHAYPNGLTPYIAMGTVAAHPDTPEIPLCWDHPEIHDRQAYAELFVMADKLRVHGEFAQKQSRTALQRITHGECSPLWQRDLEAALTVLRDGLAELGQCESVVRQDLQEARLGETLGERRVWANLLETLPEARQHGWKCFAAPDSASWTTRLHEATALLEMYCSTQAKLSDSCRHGYVELLGTVEKLHNYGRVALDHAASVLRFVGHSQWSPEWQQEVVQLLETLRQGVSRLQQAQAEVATLLGMNELGNDRKAVAQWGALLDCLSDAWGHRWEFLLAPDADRILNDLHEGLTLLEGYTETTAALSAPYAEAVFDLDLEALQRQWDEAKKAWFGSLRASGVRKALKSVCAADTADCEQDLPVLVNLLRVRQRLAQTERLAAQTDGLWAGLATDQVEARAALEFGQRLRTGLVSLRMTPVQFGTRTQALQGLLGSANSLLGPAGSGLC